MRKILLATALLAIIISCSGDHANMVVSGNVDGLKKGWLYLQKLEDSLLVSIDSIEIRGEGSFSFETTIEHPEIFYLYLDKADNNEVNDRIAFFGEEGAISITTSWNKFEADAEVSGSKNHMLYAEYQNMMSNFIKRDLELAQLAFTQTDSLKADSLEILAERNYVNRFRYLLNFGLTHPNSHVTPYIAITDGTEANPIFLDSIYHQLPDSIAQSKYGALLGEMVLEKN